MLDQTLAQLMQRLLEREAPSTPLNATARRLLENLGIGRIQGKTLYLSERDRQEMGVVSRNPRNFRHRRITRSQG